MGEKAAEDASFAAAAAVNKTADALHSVTLSGPGPEQLAPAPSHATL